MNLNTEFIRYTHYIDMPPPSRNGGKWRLIGIPYQTCIYTGGHCYWAGEHPKLYLIIYIELYILISVWYLYIYMYVYIYVYMILIYIYWHLTRYVLVQIDQRNCQVHFNCSSNVQSLSKGPSFSFRTQALLIFSHHQFLARTIYPDTEKAWSTCVHSGWCWW